MKDDQADKLVCVLERLTDEVHRCHLAITEANKIAGLATKQDLIDAEQRLQKAIKESGQLSEYDRAVLQATLNRARKIAARITALDSKTTRPP